MIGDFNNIVQFVGFKTILNEKHFLTRWHPFAINFKNSGIKSIDLYRVYDNDEINFVSKNIWDKETYFRNFPNGIAGSGNGGGISVEQLGGYWLPNNTPIHQNEMILVFSKTIGASLGNKNSYIRLSVIDNFLYKHVLEYSNGDFISKSDDSLQINCKHITQI